MMLVFINSSLKVISDTCIEYCIGFISHNVNVILSLFQINITNRLSFRDYEVLEAIRHRSVVLSPVFNGTNVSGLGGKLLITLTL